MEGLTLDWRITCTYYSALHWLEALRCHQDRGPGGEPVEVQSHIRRMASFRRIGLAVEILEVYVDLEALSRMARYEVSPAYNLEERHLVVARNLAGQVINHARRELHQAGYRLPARR